MTETKIAIVDEGSSVSRWERIDGQSVKVGAVWGPAADGSNEWFGLRHDVDDGEPRRLPSRAEAVAWIERPVCP